jgi:methylglutaconyl-CoA hydratase
MKSTPNTSLIQLEINGSIANITLARSEKFNAMNADLISELIEVFTWAAQHSVGKQESLVDSEGNENLRVLVLSGEGKHFCAGADINMMRDAGANTPEENRRDSKRLDELFNSLWAHPCFTIGCIQGVALGGGAGLISCLDYVIAEKGVKIALSEGKLGILPAVIGPYVYRRIGSAQFRRLAMMAKRIGGEEALRIGMIDELVEDTGQFEQCVSNAVSEVMTTGPMAVAEVKSLTLTFDRWNGSDEELREWTLDKTSEMRGSPEGQEGLASFLEKRSPDWKNEE